MCRFLRFRDKISDVKIKDYYYLILLSKHEETVFT